MIATLILETSSQPSTQVAIIKAVTDPFSLLALIVTVLSGLGLRALEGTSGRLRFAIVLIFVASLTALGLNTLRLVNTDTKGRAEAKAVTLNASILFKGSHQEVHSQTVPFQVSSGQVNFGCGDSAHPVVTFDVPPGAREISPAAHWVNTDNVKSLDQQAIVAGTTVTATGNIAGLDRDFIGNCHGGGHGELILTGTYTIDQPSTPQPITKVIQASMTPGTVQVFDLPSRTDLNAGTCDIAVASDRGPYAHLLLTTTSTAGVLSSTVVNKSGPIEANVGDGKLSVRVD